MRLVLLHGAPGVGKLTTGRELSALTGFPIFHNHLTLDMLASVFDFASEPFCALREQIWLAVMARAAREKLPGLIFTFVFEPTVAPGFYSRLRAAVEAEGGSVHPVELRCSLEENLRRVESEERRRFLKTRDAAMVRGGIESGDYIAGEPLPGNIVIDITSLPAGASAREIVSRLGLG